MGIFDFFRSNKNSKSDNTEKRNIDSSQESDLNTKRKFVTEKIASVLDLDKEIILSEKEINQYVWQEIEERTYGKSDKTLDFSSLDSQFIEAAKLVIENQQASASLIQRKLKVGYNKANKLIDELESAKIVGAFNGTKARTINLPNLSYLQLYLKTHLVKYKRFENFRKNVLPLHEDYISSKVIEILRAKEVAKENELKEILKQEILDKENEKLEKERIRELKREARKELIEDGIISSLNESDLKREPIPQDILDKVWNRDGGKCVKCGSQEKLEFDHIIPFSKGGSNTYRNLQILCEKCNRQKSNSIG